MEYSISDISIIKSRIFAKIAKEIELAYQNDEINDLLDKYGIILEDERLPINTRTHRILVVGDLAGKLKDYQMIIKRVGINPENVEFLDYHQFKMFNARNLEYSNDYSDIIFGPVPHKTTEMGDTSSLLALMKKEPLKYPRVIPSVANSTSNQLKLSISSFKECLLKTFYYETLLDM